MARVVEDCEVATVALASLVKMVGLLCAELVVGSHRDDIDVIENAVRAKLHADVDGISAGATAAGVALAHQLVEPVLRGLRERAKQLDAPQSSESARPCPAERLN